MAAPIVPIMIAALALLQGVNSYKSSQNAYDWSDKAANETMRFFQAQTLENGAYLDRYLQKHHLSKSKVRYPIRAGMDYSNAPLFGALATLSGNTYGRKASAIGLGQAGMNYIKTINANSPSRSASSSRGSASGVYWARDKAGNWNMYGGY